MLQSGTNEIQEVLEKLSGLLESWGIDPSEWILTGQYADVLQGYDVKVRKGHLNVLVPKAKIPWEIDPVALEFYPPIQSRYGTQYQDFIKSTQFGFDLIPHSEKDFLSQQQRSGSYTLPNGKEIFLLELTGELVILEDILSKSNEKGWGVEKGHRIYKYVEELRDVLLNKGESVMTFEQVLEKYKSLGAVNFSKETRMTVQRAGTDFKLPFDPNSGIFRWGPVPGKFCYLSIFSEVHYKHFRKRFKENWPESLFLFYDGRMLWLNDLTSIEKVGKDVFLKYMLPQPTRQKIYEEWRQDTKNLSEFEADIEKANVGLIPDQALLQTWNDFNSLYTAFLVTGSVPELANYGSVPYLQTEINRHIPDEKTRIEVLRTLTAPTRLSFYQKEEVDLSETKDIHEHQKKYFWLKNSYAGTQVLSVDFFEERKKPLPLNLKQDAVSKIAEAVHKKDNAQAHYALSAEIRAIAGAISEGIIWQDERKKFILVALYYQDVLLHEVARRFGYPFEDLQVLGHNDVAKIIKGRDVHAEIAKRKKGFGIQFFHSHRELSSAEVSYFWTTYESKSSDGIFTEVKGTVASKGNNTKVVGRVRILLDPSKAEDFKQGEILLAPMTSPEYIFAMKKSLAVVTDEGGLTSHAAIVSRELAIPCIVGTKNATKVLKDGDMVEVDAENGIVRKL